MIGDMKGKVALVAAASMGLGSTEVLIPLESYGRAEELARVVAFFCSVVVSYVTGQSILVDGGMVKAL